MKKQKIYRILFVICAIAFAISAGVLFYYWRGYQESANEYEEIAQSAVMVKQNPETEAAVLEREEQQGEEPRTENVPALVVDFDSLKATNGDCVAWIDFPGQDISYPVVKGTDNEHYLRYTFNGTRNAAGSIFQDSRNGEMMEDNVTIIYGHNMKNGSMFGLLKKYRDQAHMDQFPFFDVYTPEGAYRCQIIMAGNVRAQGDYYQVSFANEEARGAYLQLMKKNSWYDLPEAVSDESVPLVEYIRSLVADDGHTGESVGGANKDAEEEALAADTEAADSAADTKAADAEAANPEAADADAADPEVTDGTPPLVLLSTCTGNNHTYRFVLLGQVVRFYEN